MTFEPEPGMRLHLGKDEVIEFLPLEEKGPASVFVYAESGKEGTVYKVLKNQERYALKVFYPEYRDIRLLENTERLTRFKQLEGFRVAERDLFEPEEYPQLLRQYPDLTYAVLMPWIEGTVWGNMMLDPQPSLQVANYLQIAKTLIRVVNNLEVQGLAHCDLSNNNFIIVDGFSEVQLIDVEDMYAPGMPRPIPDVSYGTVGYRTRWIAENGLWGPESDRFAIAILCCEILAWHAEEIRKNRSGNTSFFDEEEIGEESERYKLITRCLDDVNGKLPPLLEKAWFANDFSQCPPVAEWFETIQKVGEATVSETVAESATVISSGTESASGEVEASTDADSTSSEAEARSASEMEPSAEEESVVRASENIFVSEGGIPTDEVLTVQKEGTAPTEEEEQSEIETLAQKRDGTIPRGVPPKMDVSIDNLEFGIVGRPENSRKFSITNSGGAPLVITVQHQNWINVSQDTFVLAPGERQFVTAVLNAKYPHPKTGREFLTPNALDIQSNAGGEVIGARFTLPKIPFYEIGWKRATLGVILGAVFGCLIGFLLLLSDFEEVACFVIPAIAVLFGLAGLASYPRKASILASIAGFVVAEILAIIMANSLNLSEESAVALFGVAGGLGVLGGAIASRLFFRKSQTSRIVK